MSFKLQKIALSTYKFSKMCYFGAKLIITYLAKIFIKFKEVEVAYKYLKLDRYLSMLIGRFFHVRVMIF